MRVGKIGDMAHRVLIVLLATGWVQTEIARPVRMVPTNHLRVPTDALCAPMGPTPFHLQPFPSPAAKNVGLGSTRCIFRHHVPSMFKGRIAACAPLANTQQTQALRAVLYALVAALLEMQLACWCWGREAQSHVRGVRCRQSETFRGDSPVSTAPGAAPATISSGRETCLWRHVCHVLRRLCSKMWLLQPKVPPLRSMAQPTHVAALSPTPFYACSYILTPNSWCLYRRVLCALREVAGLILGSLSLRL
mmetsp:Transcript_96953/g.141815  ORF Transcript_96953/g.141815 Transcript_96953/m.141815 type:complete len:249 (-) Transcript_96953:277-1023(-)